MHCRLSAWLVQPILEPYLASIYTHGLHVLNLPVGSGHGCFYDHDVTITLPEGCPRCAGLGSVQHALCSVHNIRCNCSMQHATHNMQCAAMPSK